MVDDSLWAGGFRNEAIHIVGCRKWVRCFVAGVAVADTKRALIQRSIGYRRGTPVYYFPAEDVRMDLLQAGATSKNDPHLGDATYYSLRCDGRTVEDAAWRFGQPHASAEGFERDDAPDLRGYVAFVWDKMDAWFEEEEEVFKHARDPYKRIDCLPSRRHVRVILGGEVVADTDRPILLYETGYLARYYIPRLDVRQDLLRDSDTVTRCPYKGLAHYHSVEVGGRRFEDIAWYYPHATNEAAPIAGGYLCFYDERVDRVEVDGVANPPLEPLYRY